MFGDPGQNRVDFEMISPKYHHEATKFRKSCTKQEGIADLVQNKKVQLISVLENYKFHGSKLNL